MITGKMPEVLQCQTFKRLMQKQKKALQIL